MHIDLFEQDHLQLDNALNLGYLLILIRHTMEVNGLEVGICNLKVDISVLRSHILEHVIARVLRPLHVSSMSRIGILGHLLSAKIREHLMHVEVSIIHVSIILEKLQAWRVSPIECL